MWKTTVCCYEKKKSMSDLTFLGNIMKKVRLENLVFAEQEQSRFMDMAVPSNKNKLLYL